MVAHCQVVKRIKVEFHLFLPPGHAGQTLVAWQTLWNSMFMSIKLRRLMIDREKDHELLQRPLTSCRV